MSRVCVVNTQVCVPVETVMDSRFTYLDLGVLLALLSGSVPGGGYRSLARQGSGQGSTRKALRNLENAGLLWRFQVVDAGGKQGVVFAVSPLPISEEWAREYISQKLVDTQVEKCLSHSPSMGQENFGVGT